MLEPKGVLRSSSCVPARNPNRDSRRSCARRINRWVRKEGPACLPLVARIHPAAHLTDEGEGQVAQPADLPRRRGQVPLLLREPVVSYSGVGACVYEGHRGESTRMVYFSLRPLYVRVIVGVAGVACDVVHAYKESMSRDNSAQHGPTSHHPHTYIPFGKEE